MRSTTKNNKKQRQNIRQLNNYQRCAMLFYSFFLFWCNSLENSKFPWRSRELTAVVFIFFQLDRFGCERKTARSIRWDPDRVARRAYLNTTQMIEHTSVNWMKINNMCTHEISHSIPWMSLIWYFVWGIGYRYQCWLRVIMCKWHVAKYSFFIRHCDRPQSARLNIRHSIQQSE